MRTHRLWHSISWVLIVCLVAAAPAGAPVTTFAAMASSPAAGDPHAAGSRIQSQLAGALRAPVIAPVVDAATIQQPSLGQAPIEASTKPYSPKQSLAIASSATITLTAGGFVPQLLTVTQGITVTWFNATSKTQFITSGIPGTAYHLFLPLVALHSTLHVAQPNLKTQQGASQAQGSSSTPNLTAADTFSGTLPAGGSFTHVFAITGTYPYYLSTAPAFVGSVSVLVFLPPDPASIAPPIDLSQVTDFAGATSFLYSGPNPVQFGVLGSTMEITRVAVLRGRVLTTGGIPLAAAHVSILDHPEYGYTLSRADGMFDMAANGGGQLTVVYEETGYMTAQRQVTAPWRDYVWLPDVVLLPQDTTVSSIVLTSTVPIQVARGSVISDS